MHKHLTHNRSWRGYRTFAQTVLWFLCDKVWHERGKESVWAIPKFLPKFGLNLPSLGANQASVQREPGGQFIC